jgi:hypothetical protein
MQTHKIEKSQSQGGSGGGSAGGQTATRDASSGSSGQQQEKYKHEGDSVNTEVRVSANKIEFYTGTKLVGVYDKGSDTWTINESGGNFKLIISPSHVIGQYQDTTKSFMVDKTHTHIKYGGNSIFVDAGGCWSTVPIQIKGDPT